MIKRTTILLLGLMATGAGCASMNAGNNEPSPPPRHVALSDLHDVRAARQDLIGKSRQEIVEAIGAPDRETGNVDREWWSYEDRFHDSITNRRIPVVTFYFLKGKLEDVTF